MFLSSVISPILESWTDTVHDKVWSVISGIVIEEKTADGTDTARGHAVTVNILGLIRLRQRDQFWLQTASRLVVVLL